MERQTVGGDRFLRMLAAMAELYGADIPITLNLAGVLVSGRLVSSIRYFDGMADVFLGAVVDTGSKGAAAFEGIFRQAAAGLAEDARAVADEKEERFLEVAAAVEHVHLQEATFWQPGKPPIPASGGVWWRGRLDAVAGFVLGSIEQGQARSGR
jgi:hypothetical protein